MTKELKTIENIGNGVSLTTIEIAELTGKRHDHVLRDTRNMLVELYGEGGLPKFGESYAASNGHSYDCYRLPKKECLCLVSGYSIPLRMAIITRLEELESRIPVAMATLPETRAKAELEFFETASRFLKLSEVSNLAITHDIAKRYGVPTNMLPAYVKETSVTFSAKDLLEQHGVGISSIAFNKLMMMAGLLEERERTGSSGKIKRYKALTELGLRYGQNDTSPHNPREIQPHYYADKFTELLTIIM